MLHYRTTPHTVTGISPAALMFQYNVNNDLPTIITPPRDKQNQLLNRKDKQHKLRNKAKYLDFQIRDKVLIKNMHHRNKLESFYENTIYEIIKIHAAVQVRSPNGKQYTRNKAHIKLFKAQHHNIPNKKPANLTGTAPVNQQIPTVAIAPDRNQQHDDPDLPYDSDKSNDMTIPYDLSDESDDQTIPCVLSDEDSDNNIENELPAVTRPTRLRNAPSRYSPSL